MTENEKKSSILIRAALDVLGMIDEVDFRLIHSEVRISVMDGEITTTDELLYKKESNRILKNRKANNV